MEMNYIIKTYTSSPVPAFQYFGYFSPDCSNFITNVLELLQSCAKQSIANMVGFVKHISCQLCRHAYSTGHSCEMFRNIN